ncbi:acetylornithine aminotransferase [Pisolithus orientalis]|uniref:acetylornithine aminotransferase n=1 Tax=Pisolithus orientalis TaxID=936130 RepID=UPI00222467DA|nr:acetylornithine aminotransferase [Pisolithus orientalis]KAI6033174.1 acetylornithine aminotransferase [Pisolithus orientalis]
MLTRFKSVSGRYIKAAYNSRTTPRNPVYRIICEPASYSAFKTHAQGYVTAADDPVAFGQRHVTKGIGRLTEAVMTRGEGSYVHFHDGLRLLDFTCGIGVTNLGHCHPKVSKAAADQCMELVHCQCSISFHDSTIRLIEKLIPVMPDPTLDSFYFWNSGSEATEAAVKMARVITGKQNIICMQGGYHGRTYGAMALTRSKTSYSEGFFPLMPGVFSTPFPFWHQLGVAPNTSEEELVRSTLYQLDLLLKQQTAPCDTAAIIIEPVLGEGGYVSAPSAFLKGLRDVCDEHGILLIIDEVQSGFGRTGKMFNVEYSRVRPDIMVMAKGLANGFPLSCIVSRRELTDKLKPGSMGGTYAGNVVSCAAAAAVVDAFQEENILDNVNARSKELLVALKELQTCPEVGGNIVDVRGQGLMVAVEFASPSYPAQDPVLNRSAPNNLASRVAKRCVEKGMLILTASVYEVIRFIPPLNVTREDLRKGCEVFSEAVEEIIREA